MSYRASLSSRKHSSAFSTSLMEGQHRVVRLDDRVGHFRGGDDRKRLHDAVRILLADLRNQQRAHPRASASSQRMTHLKALQAVASLGLLADDVEDAVDELGALRVVPLGPIVAGSCLPEHKVVG